MRLDPSARRALQDLKHLCSAMVSDEEQPSPSEFASIVNDILDPNVSAGPKKRFKPRGLFLGERRDSGAPIDIPSQVLARHAAMLGSTGSGKTVMAKALIEEAALAGIPSLIIDPQGDLARLALGIDESELIEKDGDVDRKRKLLENSEIRIWTPLRSKG